MKPTFMAALAVVGVLAGAAFVVAGQQMAKTGEKAPDFSEKGSDGKNHTLKSLTKEGPVFLYFIKDGCPVNDQAYPFYNSLAKAYGDKATFVGVYNGDAEGWKRWQAKTKAPYVALLDDDYSVIKSYKALRSPWVIRVDPNGTIGKVQPGYSVKDLTALNASMAGAAKIQAKELNLAGAPSDTRFG